MRLFVLCTALPVVFGSCGLSRGSGGAAELVGGDPRGADRDAYAELEYIEEHPLDLMTADPYELLSLPGFPEGLAYRVVEERKRNGTARRLFRALTPPEREALRRYEAYLDLPADAPLRLEAWYTADRLGGEGERRDDARLSSRSGSFRLRARYRSEDIYRLYLAGSILSGHLLLHAGDLMPELAMGLCFSSYRTTYPFSHGYHIRTRRWISGTTSLYGASMRGGAAELWAGPVHLLVLGGREAAYRDGELRVDGPAVLCGRAALRFGGCSAGLALHTIGEVPGEPVCSVDLSWEGGSVRTGAEIASNGLDWCGLSAVSLRGDRTRTSMLFYWIPREMDHPLGRSFYGAGKWRRGVSIVLDRRLGRRVRVLFSFERADAGVPRETKRRDLLRLECCWSARGNSVKLALRRRIEQRSLLLPCPPTGEEPARKVEDSIHLLQRWRLLSSLFLRVSCRVPLERGSKGYLICPSLSVDRGVTMHLSWALHRAIEGSPLFYCYERSLKGIYPWRAIRGDGWRLALTGGLSAGPLRFAGSLATTNKGVWEGATQMGLKF